MFSKLLGIISLFFLFTILLIYQNVYAQNGNKKNKEMSKYKRTGIINPANIRSTVFSEDFSGRVLPDGWTNLSNIGGNHIWQFNNPGNRVITGAFDSDFAIIDSYYYGTGITENSSLTTRAINAADMSTVYFGFFQQFRGGIVANGKVEVSTDKVNWLLLDNISQSIGFPNPPAYTEYDVSEIAAGQPTVYFRWTYTATFAWWWAIDNVVVYEPDLYPNPAVNVSPSDEATNISINPSLNWTNDGGAPPTGYRIYFGTDGGGITPPMNIENNNDLGLTTTYTPASALSFNTTYYWMIIPYSNEGDATGNVIWSFSTAEDLAPIFLIEPDLLDFDNVEVGGSTTFPFTISNTGDANLIISNIISSDDQFSFTPDIFPITILPGDNQVFEVSFTPQETGPISATLQITHGAQGSPFTYSLRGTGVDAGPLFISDHASLNFGNVNPGSNATLNVTITNPGTVNPLIISDAAIDGSEYTVEPSSATINAGGYQSFAVTFNPPSEGSYSDTLIFTDNASGSPHKVALRGNGALPAPATGLVFETDSVLQLEDDAYTETMKLINLTADAHAIQFKLLFNSENNDNTILTFQNIQKGFDINDANWVLNYSVFRGPITSNGASIDTVYVLIYNLNQTATLPSGDYNDLLTVKYRIADLSALQDSIRSSIKILGAEASTYLGNPVEITPSIDRLTVIAKNRISSLGDVNGDGCLDILDLILVVDHIVHKDSLKGDAFTRADIAPWPTGTQAPSPDGVINVQDLSLIQYIILSRVFPNSTTLNGCNYAMLQKVSGDVDAAVTVYINKEGITAYLDSRLDIRGAQIEFGNLSDEPANLDMNTDLGEGYYMSEKGLLRTLMYDRLAVRYIKAGKHFLADMPFSINNPEEISIDKIILVDINRKIIDNISVEIICGNAPSLPLDYILYQNYPNPFNPGTTVKFQVPKTSSVSVKIYDMLGQEVRVLYAGQIQRGTYSLYWDGLNNAGIKMSSGTYIYRMQADDFIQSKKMLLLR